MHFADTQKQRRVSEWWLAGVRSKPVAPRQALLLGLSCHRWIYIEKIGNKKKRTERRQSMFSMHFRNPLITASPTTTAPTTSDYIENPYIKIMCALLKLKKIANFPVSPTRRPIYSGNHSYQCTTLAGSLTQPSADHRVWIIVFLIAFPHIVDEWSVYSSIFLPIL